jgi:hypothetical protein
VNSSTVDNAEKRPLFATGRQAGARVAGYLNTKYPPAQALAIALAAFTAYLAGGRLGGGEPSLGWPAVAASGTGSLLFLQVRLLDDLDTHYSGHDRIKHGTPRGLLAGVGVTTAIIIALNPEPGVVGFAILPTAVMLGASLVLALWCPLRTSTPLTRRRPDLIALVFGRIPLFDAGPVLAFLYVTAKWEESTGRDLSGVAVLLVVGVFWVLYEIWKMSRNIGRYEGYDDIYQPYRMSWLHQRVFTAILATGSLALSVALYATADLSVGFLIYAAVLSFALAALALSGRHEAGRPWWRGLLFPAAMIVGLLTQFLVTAA